MWWPLSSCPLLHWLLWVSHSLKKSLLYATFILCLISLLQPLPRFLFTCLFSSCSKLRLLPSLVLSVRIERDMADMIHNIYNASLVPPLLDYTLAWLAYFIDVACIVGLVLLFIESMREQEVVEEAIKDLTGGEPADPVESILRYSSLSCSRGNTCWHWSF